jgi:ATP-binding cassette, subfamily B, bacterial PglK
MFKKILFLLDKRERKNFYILLMLLIVMGLMDTLGIVSILPFITVLSNPEILETNSIVVDLIKKLRILGINNYDELIFFTGLIFLIFFIFSLIFKSFVSYLQIKFSYMREHSICQRLTKHYFNQPYVWFLGRNSSDLCNNILSEIGQIIFSSIFAMINFISQIILVFMILIVLLFINPKATILLISICFLVYGLIYLFIKKRFVTLGEDRLRENKNRFLALSNIFSSMKTIKIYGKEDYFVNHFFRSTLAYAKNNTFAQTISILPRYFVELIAFGGIIIFILISIEIVEDFNKIIPFISLYVFAGYKLLPALQQAYHNGIQMKHASTGLTNLCNDLKNYEIQEKESTKISNQINFEKQLKLKNISFKYPNSKNLILNNLNITIPAFSKVGLLGKSGTGKSTLIDIILGLLKANSGKIEIDNVEVNDLNITNWQNKIGYVPQQIQLLDATIKENIAFGVDLLKIDSKKIEEVAGSVNLHNFIINDLPNGYNTIIGENGARISGGQKQRIAIARALYRNPSILIFDEATNSLDQFSENIVLEAINNLDKKITTITITHRIATIKNCDIIFLMKDGKIKFQGHYYDLEKSLNKSIDYKK